MAMALPIFSAVLLTHAAVAHATEAPRATYDEPTGRVTITDGGKTVLVYHYKNVPVPAEFSGAKKHNKYAVPRSNYIHPMCGLDGVPLTSDWNEDHPHHRGIYWAWPEVFYYNEIGDLHALQRVWARPTGKIETRSGDGWVEIEAENRWMWEDKTPIVHETAVIRTWRAGEHGRWIDLALRFEALEDGVTLARRGTTQYGGMNIRMAKIEQMQLLHHVDPEGSSPRAAWQLAVGRWPGAGGPSSLAIFEKSTNPGYPADYVQYPDLSWFQPAFPRAKTRHALEKAGPLTLQYRFWIRQGAVPSEKELRDQHSIYQKWGRP
jgi:hypothetical protein